MAVQCGPIGRRQTLAGLSAAGVVAAAPTIGSAQTKVAPITVVINQSPWFDSFRKTVELYEKETGNKVELDVNPFAGSLEKQRNSVRARQGQYDLLIMNSGWFAEMYFGGFVEALSDIDPGFKLDPDIFTLGNTVYFDPAKKTVGSGKLMSMPISPLIPVLYYRGDLYKEAGLVAPRDLRRSRGQCAQAQQAAAAIRHRPARRARPGQRQLRLLSLPLRLRRQRLQGPGGRRLRRGAEQRAGPHGARLLHPLVARGRTSQDRGDRPGRSHPEHGHGQGRARHDGDLGLVADGRPDQVGRRRQGRVRADAARARLRVDARPRPLAGRRGAERPRRPQAGRRSRSCAGTRPSPRRWRRRWPAASRSAPPSTASRSPASAGSAG